MLYEQDMFTELPRKTVKKAPVPRSSKKSRRRYAPPKQMQTTFAQQQKLRRESIFKWPIDQDQFWLSSFFGVRKKPDGSIGFHKGIDLAAIKGTPVKAAGAGVVIESTEVPGYGNTIVIAHSRKFKTRYAHLLDRHVRVGQHVRQAEKIGRVGTTGNVRKSRRGGSGSHLHFEVYMYGKQVNPFYFLA